MADTVRFGENGADTHNAVTQDTFIRGAAYQYTNYNGQNLAIKKDLSLPNNTRKTLLRFDLSAEAGKIVSAATLYLWHITDQSINLQIFSNLRAWVETTATYATYDGSNPWGANHDADALLASGASGGVENAYVGYSGAGLVAYLQAVLNGTAGLPGNVANLLLWNDSTNYLEAEDRVGPDGRRPYLEMTVAAAPGPAGGTPGRGAMAVRLALGL